MDDRFETSSPLEKIGIILTGLAAIFFVSLLLALPVMWLWNSTIPDLFNLSPIDWWTAWKLMLLCSFVFNNRFSFSSK